MIRNLKAVGLALMAVCAFAAVSATGASAAGEKFHSENEPAILTGTTENINKFTASGFSVECNVGHFSGTSSTKTPTTLSVFPNYTECTSSLGAATVDTAGCTYVFHSETSGGDLPVSISCTESNTIKVTAPGCTLSFGTQNTTGGATATNIGSGSTREVTVHATVTATFTKSGAFCFAISGTTGKYEGTSKVAGYVDNGVHGDPHTTSATYTEGAQMGVWWE